MSYNSQIGQDKWVHSILGNKTDGYFIELGAYDGVYLSNTLFFERNLNWNGICIEPNDNYIKELYANRKCNISNEVVYSCEGEKVNFALCGFGSGIINENTGPFNKKDQYVSKTTTTLGNILNKFNAPSIIDYLSLDVEGQEYSILSTFPFDKYKFRCITVEHNSFIIGPKQQMLIRKLLEENNYKFIKCNDNWHPGPIDDFYINSTLI
jgi:FkbM family methyltransferase